MNKKVRIVLTAVIVLALYPIAHLVTHHPRAAAQPKVAPMSYLFVQTAAKIDYKDGVLTLYDVPRQTMYFTDRPNRVVGNMPTEKFVAMGDGQGPERFCDCSSQRRRDGLSARRPEDGNRGVEQSAY